MDSLTQLQRYMLMVLEEAGEENISTLRNTVGKCCGSFEEIDAMSAALTDLLNRELIEIGDSRDKSSLRWISWAKKDSLTLLGDLKPFIQWSVGEQLWKWDRDISRAQVLLTDSGLATARKILSRDGYPEDFFK